MSVWVIGLGLAAGYLINKNLTMDARLQEAAQQFNQSPDTETEVIREVKRAVPIADRYQDMNLQDLPPKDVELLTANQAAAAQAVASYESMLPEISGVYLSHERGL